MEHPNRITFDESAKAWRLTSEAHIRLKIKRLLPSAVVDRTDLLIQLTNDNTEDVAWLLDRYPHHGESFIFAALREQVAANKARREEAAAIFRPGYDLSPPPKLAFPLRKYQEEGVAFSRVTDGWVLGDDLGLGKTVTAIGIIADRGGRVAVVCPTHLQRQWKAQLNRFLPSVTVHIAKKTEAYETPGIDVLIIPYSKALGWSHADPFDGIIFDEVQHLRKNDSKRYAACRNMALQTSYRVGLSATPVFNYGAEIHSIYDIVAPGAVGDRDEFVIEWDANAKGAVKEPKALGTWLRSQNLLLRRTRAEVGRELPPLNNITIEVEQDVQVIERLRGEFNELAERVLHASFLDRGLAARAFNMKLRQTTGISKANQCMDFTLNLVEEEGVEKVILAAWHRAVFDIFHARLVKSKIGFASYTGEESAARKDESVRRFTQNPDVQIFLISLRSGEGLDGLQEVCNTVVFAELDWTPKMHDQLTGRAHRDGQEKPVTAYYLLSEIGSDPFISNLLGIKEAQARGVENPNAAEFLPAAEEENLISELARSWLAS